MRALMVSRISSGVRERNVIWDSQEMRAGATGLRVRRDSVICVVLRFCSGIELGG